MTFQIFNQYDPRWSGHALGAEPHELGPFGCFLVLLTMVAWDSFEDLRVTPDHIDEVLFGAGIFSDDNLPNNALDRKWPGRFSTSGWYGGWRSDLVDAAVAAPDRYAWLHIVGYSPLWKINCNHYVLAFGGTKIADPAGGVVRDLSAYGGTVNVKGVTVCQKITPAPVVTAPPVVVVNQPPPILIPVVIAVPDPLFTWKAGDGKGQDAKQLYDVTVSEARAYATAHDGVLVEVLDEKGKTVETEFVAPKPGPKTLPSVPAVATTTAPAHVQQPDFWAVLQSWIIRLMLSLRQKK